jgi:N-acetylmuramoyl-L-alanine amidase
MESSPRPPATTPQRRRPREPQRRLPSAGWGAWLLLASAIVLVVGSLAVSATLVVAGTGRYRDGQGEAGAISRPTATPAQSLPSATEAPATPPPTTESAEQEPEAAASGGGVVCLDPGHGGKDLGKTIYTAEGEIVVTESELVLEQAFDLQGRLEAQGLTVVLTRTEDEQVNASGEDVNGDGEVGEDGGSTELDDLQARINVCNAAGADLMVSLHINGSENEALRGYEAWYTEGRPFSEDSARITQLIHDALGEEIAASGYETISRGWADDSVLFPGDGPGTFDNLVLTGPSVPGKIEASQMPGVIAETLFLSNEDDAAYLQTPEGHEAIVTAYESAILDYFEIEPS